MQQRVNDYQAAKDKKAQLAQDAERKAEEQESAIHSGNMEALLQAEAALKKDPGVQEMLQKPGATEELISSVLDKVAPLEQAGSSPRELDLSNVTTEAKDALQKLVDITADVSALPEQEQIPRESFDEEERERQYMLAHNQTGERSFLGLAENAVRKDIAGERENDLYESQRLFKREKDAVEQRIQRQDTERGRVYLQEANARASEKLEERYDFAVLGRDFRQGLEVIRQKEARAKQLEEERARAAADKRSSSGIFKDFPEWQKEIKVPSFIQALKTTGKRYLQSGLDNLLAHIRALCQYIDELIKHMDAYKARTEDDRKAFSQYIQAFGEFDEQKLDGLLEQDRLCKRCVTYTPKTFKSENINTKMPDYEQGNAATFELHRDHRTKTALLRKTEYNSRGIATHAFEVEYTKESGIQKRAYRINRDGEMILEEGYTDGGTKVVVEGMSSEQVLLDRDIFREFLKDETHSRHFTGLNPAQAHDALPNFNEKYFQ